MGNIKPPLALSKKFIWKEETGVGKGNDTPTRSCGGDHPSALPAYNFAERGIRDDKRKRQK